jgi:hypothetical protein
MEANKKRRCIICGKEYSYCPKCRKDKDKPVWMFTFDSQNCHDIYQVLIDEQYGHITEAEAKAKLQKLDLSGKANFDEATRTLVEKIMNYSGVVSEVKSTATSTDGTKSSFSVFKK